MRCYYHADAEGVALCKHCYRALCRECAADAGAGMACRGRCEEEVRLVGRVTEASKQMVLGTHGTQKHGLPFMFLFGGALIICGLLVLPIVGSRIWPMMVLLVALGVLIVGYAAVTYRALRAQRDDWSRS